MDGRRALTLIELLVVIGIVAVLAGLAMSAFAGAREAARTATCLSNLRQMAAAATDYAMANEGSYPPAQVVDAADPAVLRAWDFTKRGGNVLGPGFLWAPRPVTAAQQCPAFDGRSQSAGDPFTGYNYNTSYIGRGTGEGPPARIAQVKDPSRTALFGDGQWSLGANKYMRSPLRVATEPSTYTTGSSARAGGTQGYRHRGATNVAFCDGHAETVKERFTAGNGNVVEGTGFLSEDNRMYDLE